MHCVSVGRALPNSVRDSIIGLVTLLMSAQAAYAETAVERGSYLVNTIMACGNCHTPRDANGAFVSGKAFSGGLTITTPAFAATAPNITQDRDTGIGDWSDAEIKRALIEGVRPDHGHLGGVTLAAVMPANFYKALLPEDLDAIVAYLRTVKAVRNTVPEPEYKMPVHRQPYPDAEKGFAKSEFSDSVRHGAYLVTIGHCMGMSLDLVGRRLRLQGWFGARRATVRADNREGTAQYSGAEHHFGSRGRHRCLERYGDRARDPAGHRPRRPSSQSADGVCVLRMPKRCRYRGHHRIFAYAEVTCGRGARELRRSVPSQLMRALGKN